MVSRSRSKNPRIIAIRPKQPLPSRQRVRPEIRFSGCAHLPPEVLAMTLTPTLLALTRNIVLIVGKNPLHVGIASHFYDRSLRNPLLHLILSLPDHMTRESSPSVLSQSLMNIRKRYVNSLCQSGILTLQDSSRALVVRRITV
jgi:hypothetical protein